MVPKYNRAVRRYHLARMKARARKIYPWNTRPEKWANTLKMCSCWMCGNLRHSMFESAWTRLTHQEQRSLLNFQDDLLDFDNPCWVVDDD